MNHIVAFQLQRTRVHGMTLVEILIALAIASLMTLTGWRAIDALQTSRDRVIADAATWQRIDDLFATLEADLRRASLTEFSGSSDSLTLMQPAIDGNPMVTAVRYITAPVATGMNGSDGQPLQRISRDSGNAQTPMADVNAVNFTYSIDGVTFTPTASTYPRALRIRIATAGVGAATDSVERTLALR